MVIATAYFMRSKFENLYNVKEARTDKRIILKSLYADFAIIRKYLFEHGS